MSYPTRWWWRAVGSLREDWHYHFGNPVDKRSQPCYSDEMPASPSSHAPVSCTVCWCSVIEAHWEPHYQWHVRMGDVPDADSTMSAP